MKNSGDFENVFLAYPDGSQKNANGVILPSQNNDPRKWEWYTQAQSNGVFLSDPSIAASSGQYVVSIGTRVHLFTKTLVLGADIKITDIIENTKKVILPGDGSMFIITMNGNIFSHENANLLNKMSLF